jgi:hypothetical protein
MSGKRVFWGVVVLVAMQVFGQGVVWELLWSSGLKDVRIMSTLWWAWTIAQVLIAVPVGVSLARWGLARFAPPRSADFLPAAWRESARTGRLDRATPTSALRTA